jgi:hypothetical protein
LGAPTQLELAPRGGGGAPAPRHRLAPGPARENPHERAR